MTMTDETMDQAIQTAIKLHANLGQDGVASAYVELEKAIHAFEDEGYPLESIIPQGGDSGLGFSLKRADGKTFFEIYSGLIRKSLCTADGEFNKLIKSGLNSSVGAILTVIVTSLGIPIVALGIMIPIAVIIATTGIDTFCEFTKEGK
jgi:hypothetical protein